MSSSPTDPIGGLIVPPPAFPNPNAHRNRAPAKSELLGLQSFVDINSRIMGMLDGAIEELRGSYDALQARYTRQQLDLEATLSELHKANDLLVAIQKQRIALQAEQDDLRALMHPIRRCPSDILEQIFELTMVGLVRRRERMRQAICCSSVCQRWRAIALEAPRLWTHLSLWLKEFPQSQEFLRTHIIPRVKQVATDVVLWPVDSESIPALAACGLQDIPVMQILQLQFGTPNDILYLLGPNFIPPKGIMQTLCLFSTVSTGAGESRPDLQRVDILRLLAKFPPLTKLTINCLPNFSFSSEFTKSNISTLELYSMGEVNIMEVFLCFPNLESLDLRGTTAVVNNTQDVLPVLSVKRIRLRDADEDGEWMENLIFPRLEALTYLGDPTEAFLAFVSAHKSMVTLITNFEADGIAPRLSGKVPWLQELQILPPFESIYHSLEGSLGFPFPSLRSLVVNCGDVSLERFDALVCARCLPMRHPRSQAKQPSDIISRFAIMTVVTPDPSSAPQWNESGLYKESSKVTDKEEPDKMYLSWPEWE